MKKITFLFLLCSTILLAQQKKHKVIYAVTNTKSSPYTIDKKTNVEVKKLLKEVETELPKIRYELNFTKNESYFTLKNNLQNEGDFNLSTNLAKNKVGDGVFYTNRKENKIIEQKEFDGEWRLVISKFNRHKWKTTNEKKMIKGFICYKAKSTYVWEAAKGTITEQLIAWYCPSIPFPFGPLGYGGLPGVILEMDNGKSTLYAVRINLNTENELKIEEPTKGEKITVEEDRKRERAWLDAFVKKYIKKE